MSAFCNLSPGGLVRKGYEKIILKTLNTKSAYRSMETTHELQSWLSLVVICSISNSARRLLQNYCLPNLFSCQKSSAVASCNHLLTLGRAGDVTIRPHAQGSVSAMNGDSTSSRFASIPLERFGGADRDRTDDILLAKQALSQLSYSPTG